MLQRDSNGRGYGGEEPTDRRRLRPSAMRTELRLTIGYLVCLLLLGGALAWGILHCGC